MTSTRIWLGSSEAISSVTVASAPYLTELVTSSEARSFASGTSDGLTSPVRESIAARAAAGARRSRGMSTRRIVDMTDAEKRLDRGNDTPGIPVDGGQET